MLILAAIGAFVGTILFASVFATIFASERVRRRRGRKLPYAL